MKRVLVVFLVFFGLCLCACRGNDESGTVRVVVKGENGAVLADAEIAFTKDDTLVDLLEKHEAIKMKGTTYPGMGFFIEELCGVRSETAFWNIFVDGEESMVGVSQIPLKDGGEIEFVLTPFE